MFSYEFDFKAIWIQIEGIILKFDSHMYLIFRSINEFFIIP